MVSDPLYAGIELSALLPVLRQLCWDSAAILRAYARGTTPPFGYPPVLSVSDDPKSPVSAADLAVNEHLLSGFARAFPGAPWTILSEETVAQWPPGTPIDAEWLWILDPLDGTKDFLQGTGEYAVHLALVHHQRPVLGLVLLPELDQLWIGVLDAGHAEAWCESPSAVRTPVTFSSRSAPAELIPVTSRSHRDDRLEPLMDALGVADGIARGSVGGKVAAILRGETDLYVSLSGRSAPKDWDMAAPEAVLLAAGGSFTHPDESPLKYNTGDYRQAGCLIASHGVSHQALCQAAARAMASIDPDFPL
ncbi:3'(2'),5'-bisphosphate nucleotidase CysQ [Synechococcus sp. CBW1107]|jgi:3'(2'), 5'-bisphosphate nucleotidase|uniref:3'(2'),5'-bisphosphate nucleotidase CysQ family protein n=1 Tax=Synechococcus sp. CBW1107 TaxID=2789857 RepID=UPI002AD525CC|nr:3'(2'),5'-bisphosphate nucleotidase CysQ [Synechococcus sp. CBW1107]CAK6698028.1 3'(2'),5'-bisphosphate nucleotidase CysQ [Synechococcus sp. CBW1107]